MRLVRIARDRWDVLAACDERGDCYVLDFLGKLGGSYEVSRDSMLSLLREYLPANGPQRLREPICKSIGDGFYEFRKEPKGKRLRVIWFYDTGKVVVCTTAFTKDAKIPRSEIQRANRLRDRYFLDQRRGKLTVS